MAALVDGVELANDLDDLTDTDVVFPSDSGTAVAGNYRYQGGIGLADEAFEDNDNSGTWAIIGGPNA